MKKVAFHTLGCKVNQYETEAMEEMFEKKGYSLVSGDDKADIYVINTCTVTNMSDRKSRQFIRKAKRLNNQSVIAVVGCYSQTSPEEVEKIDGVDVIIGTSERNRVVELCEMSFNDRVRINIVKDIRSNKDFEDIKVNDIKGMTRAYIKIQDGCNQFCSYCIIPYARGPIRSRELEDIYKEVLDLSLKGFKEIVLTGIHVASYGKDFKDKVDLNSLIRELSKIEGIERIRFSSLEPRLINQEFMETLVSSKKCCDHFHLSLQSGSDSVLFRMNRKYTSREYLEKVNLIRKYMPEAGITTDVIVGFPGESKDEFHETLDFVQEVGFSRLHVFKYSKREGTPAATMKDQVDGNIQNNRSKKLIKVGDSLSRSFASNYIGKTLEVLLEETSRENKLEGYSRNYLRVSVDYDEKLVGQTVDVKIIGQKGDILIGEV